VSDCGPHCPFLNRPDARCAGHFHLERLRHTFAYCFGQYQACTVYGQRLAERQERRDAGESAAPATAAATTSPNLYGSIHGSQQTSSLVVASPVAAPRSGPPPAKRRPAIRIALAG
jgi:hypothetical protein